MLINLRTLLFIFSLDLNSIFSDNNAYLITDADFTYVYTYKSRKPNNYQTFCLNIVVSWKQLQIKALRFIATCNSNLIGLKYSAQC